MSLRQEDINYCINTITSMISVWSHFPIHCHSPPIYSVLLLTHISIYYLFILATAKAHVMSSTTTTTISPSLIVQRQSAWQQLSTSIHSSVPPRWEVSQLYNHSRRTCEDESPNTSVAIRPYLGSHLLSSSSRVMTQARKWQRSLEFPVKLWRNETWVISVASNSPQEVNSY